MDERKKLKFKEYMTIKFTNKSSPPLGLFVITLTIETNKIYNNNRNSIYTLCKNQN